MDRLLEFQKSLEEYEKRVMDAPFTDIKKLIKKYGSDITDDWVFMYLSEAVFFEHEKRWDPTGLNEYEKELAPIDNKIDVILKEHGVHEVEGFSQDEMPSELKKLLKDYDELFDRTRSELFFHYGLSTFGEYYKNNKKEYLKRYEEIDKNKFVKLNLLDIVNEFENESIKCAEIKAFHAASILIASAIEGLMLSVAQIDRTLVKTFIEMNKRRKKKIELVSLTLAQMIELYKEAQMFPFNNEGTLNKINETMLKVASMVRNLIHPGRKIKAKYITNSEQEYVFLNNVYIVLKDFYV